MNITRIQVDRATPVPAVLLSALLSLAYLASSDIYSLINYVGFATWVSSHHTYQCIDVGCGQLSIGLAVVCLPWLRWSQPHWPRPIRVHLVWPALYTLATIFITVTHTFPCFLSLQLWQVVPMVASPVETLTGLGMILTGLPVYWAGRAWQRWSGGSGPSCLTAAVQRLLLVAPPTNKESFKHHNDPKWRISATRYQMQSIS